MTRKKRLTKFVNSFIFVVVTRGEIRLIRSGRRIIGLSESDFALKLGVDVNVVVALEAAGNRADGATSERALRYLISRGIAHSPLLRAARGLLGKTQTALCHEAEIAPGTYRRFEASDLDYVQAVNASGSLAKLLSYLELKGIRITFSEPNGAGVSLRGLLLVEDLPGIQNRAVRRERPKKAEVAERS